MKREHLVYVMTLAAYNNFTRAAEQLYISQAALSTQIANLEKEIGLPLFERKKSGVFLTDYGRIFCQKAEPVLAAWDALENALNASKEEYSGKLSIGLSARVYSNGLFESITAYFEQYPKIDVTYVTDFAGSAWDALKDNRIDIVLDRLPPSNVSVDMSHVAFWELIREQQCFLLSPSDPKSQWKELDYSDLEGYSYISGPSGSRLDLNLMQDCIDHSMPFTVAYRFNNMADAFEMVRRGKGFLIGPKSFAEYFHVAAVPKKGEQFVSLYFICRKSKAKQPIINRFRKFLQSEVRSFAGEIS